MNRLSFLGVPFRLHPLFVLMAALSVLTGYFIELATLFGIVLIHELGHVAAAKSLGWRIREVRLLPFGGVAEVEENGSVPAIEEIVVALAGPLQNAAMIGIAYAASALGLWDPVWSRYFIEANAMIAIFNLLPVLPLDGGKIAQALLSYWIQYYRAIWLGAWCSLILSGAMLAYCAYVWRSGALPLNLAAIAIFLLYSNVYTYRSIPFHFLRFLLHRELRIKEWIAKGTVARPIAASMSHSLKDVVRLYMREHMHFVYIFNERGELQQVLPEQRLTRIYIHGKPGSAVSELFM